MAKHFQTTPIRVERAIRNAIEITWERGNIAQVNQLFSYVDENRESPRTRFIEHGRYYQLRFTQVMRILEETGTPVFFLTGRGMPWKSPGESARSCRTRTEAHLKPKEIALIAHEDLDAMGALGLIEAQVAAVINVLFHDGTLSQPGPEAALGSRCAPFRQCGRGYFPRSQDGDLVTVRSPGFAGRSGHCHRAYPTEHAIREHMRSAALSLHDELGRFVENTLTMLIRRRISSWAASPFPSLT